MKDSLEEAAERYWTKQIYNEIASIEDIKWQAKKMYSEEIIDILDNVRYWETCPNKYKVIIEEWFKQIKSKQDE